MQVQEGLLTREEAEECIGIEFNPVRAGFHGGQDVWTRDVLNLGVRPDKAIAKVLIKRNLLRYCAHTYQSVLNPIHGTSIHHQEAMDWLMRVLQMRHKWQTRREVHA